LKKPRKILLAGSGGMIGSQLIPFLEALGNFVTPLKRGVDWNPREGVLKYELLENYDVIINLCGASIAGSWWTKERMKELYLSRIEPTRLLAQALQKLKRPPQLFLSASAVGFYGNRGDEPLTEASSCGTGFLPDLCRDWEQAASLPSKVRSVCLRMGMVLAKNQGVLAKMEPAFRLGLGAVLGSGMQWMSWIALRDLLWLIEFIIRHEALCGPINACTPFPVTNKEFTKKLAFALDKPCFLRLPAWMLRFIFGVMADEMLLSSVRAYPEKIQAAGFQFAYPQLQFSRILN
jgi:uncharacterized protein (TIGR01777 family)